MLSNHKQIQATPLQVLYEKLEFSLLTAAGENNRRWAILTFATIWAYSTDGKSMIFFPLFFQDKRIRHFMQIASTDNLHKMSKPVSWQKKIN